MSRYALLFLNGAILTVCAVFIYDARAMVLTGLMLFLPLLDRQWLNRYWRKPRSLLDWITPYASITKPKVSPMWINWHVFIWLVLVVLVIALIAIHPQHISTAGSILLFTALPEEWFFRAYVLTKIEQLITVKTETDKTANSSSQKILWLANISTSAFFTLVHLPTQGTTGLLVFFPSLLFGWLYLRYRDLVAVTLLHALSNLVFIIYIRDILFGNL